MKHSKHGSAIAPEDDIDDRGVAAKQVVRVIGAAGLDRARDRISAASEGPNVQLHLWPKRGNDGK